MDSSAEQQDVLLENGVAGPHETHPDHKAISSLPAAGDRLSGMSFDKVPSREEHLKLMTQGDCCQNGPMFQYPHSLATPESSCSPEPSPGVPGFHATLTASQGSSAESVVCRKEALQSLKLSLHMQETELCSGDSSLPLEREEQIRLQARRRLEEQLKQYRVKRHQERSSQSTPKIRPTSTLDPELMLNPEILPRASTIAMTKEYSFLRTSVPRGPKLGSLGLPVSSKGKKSSKSSKSSKIRSLADYRTEDLEPGNSNRNFLGSPIGSLKPNQGSFTSVVSEISFSSEMDDRLESSSLTGDNSSEIDGSEAGARQDGNESDSSTYSSASTGIGVYYGTGSASGIKQGGSYTVNGQEITQEAMGQFPSISEVLQAAAAECHSQDHEQETNGEVMSRRGSISSSVSMESSIAGTQDELLQVLKEKMRLEGQLETLSLEASQTLKEKTELQAQLAALNTRLQAQMEHTQSSQQKQGVLNSEVATLKQSCWDLERAMADLQTNLETKNASLSSLNNDLQVAEEQYQRLMGKVEDMQKMIVSKDNAVLDLRQQVSLLQNQLQQIQLDRTTLTNKLKTSQAEITSLQQARQWYQTQLILAQEARVRLQSEMANIQAGQMTQAGVLEHLKIENVSLSHQLTETQHRSMKEKERIATQLQSIEVDMLDQEAAFLQIQQAKIMVEEDLQRKLEEFEDEKEQLQKMASSAATLEHELEQTKVILHQRDLQLEVLQQEQLDLLKQLTMTQETLHTKGQSLSELQTRYDELSARLEELQSEATSKDDSIQFLQNEKIVLEVALQAAKMEKEGLDVGTKRLEENTEAASEILEALRQEVAVKASQVATLQQENAALKKQTQKVKEQFLQQKVMVEAYRRDASSKDQLISELKTTKKKLDSEVKESKREMVILQSEKKSVEVEHVRLQKEVSQVQQQMDELESHLQLALKERDEMEAQLQSLQFDKDQLVFLTQDNSTLRQQVEQLQEAAKKAIGEQKQRMKRLGSDLTSAQKEMKAKHRSYENAVGILSRRLQEALTAKESAEADLSKLKAQVTDGGYDQVLHDKVHSLESELQVVIHSKKMLEKELQEVISLTSQELEENREKVLELEDELQESRGFRKKIKRLEEINKKLALELEHERGRLTGLGQTNSALREHNNILESALAKREADLVQLNLQVQAVLKRKEDEDQQMKQLVQTLQVALEKEKVNVKNLKDQVIAAKAEAAHNRRHYKAAALELSEVKKELQAKDDLVKALQAEADKLQAQDQTYSQEVSQFKQELAEARSQLQHLQKELDEHLNKQPMISQEVEDLKWEVEQKEREIQSLKQHLDLNGQHSEKALEGVQSLLQNIKAELEVARDDLSMTQKDKFMLQAKVTELKNSMKTLLQQNQQLKLDLKHGRMKKRKELKGDNPSNPVTPVKIPDCPVPASLLEELLKPPTAVSKEPLKSLNSCLQQLKQEMDSLQRQMEEHTVTVHESMSSWTQMEGQLMELTAVDLGSLAGSPKETEKSDHCADEQMLLNQ
uniref:Golgin subfamily A member 3 isoform X1 n=1 Tax=Geotrypetes seraphini TaxID=260995 RepID=A0A6P8RYC6_GEOSA|nr:golgin subfamily A member 3 isoform X1 [Geotrypetes seraphini]XP_033810643.1 golgin subfamily A member 3 isoform X1 [Geotrypetes seraphini]XP_033810644.1 golgin subfamily A member 3 isoform X1 [Geotrypetes seraphini]